MKDDKAKYNEDDAKLLQFFEDANSAYESVIAQLRIDHEDLLYREMVKGMLKRQTKSHLLVFIWKNLSDDQARHLRDYVNQMSIVAPFISSDDLILEFALMYPELKEKSMQAISQYFELFVCQFNELLEA